MSTNSFHRGFVAPIHFLFAMLFKNANFMGSLHSFLQNNFVFSFVKILRKSPQKGTFLFFLSMLGMCTINSFNYNNRTHDPNAVAYKMKLITSSSWLANTYYPSMYITSSPFYFYPSFLPYRFRHT